MKLDHTGSDPIILSNFIIYEPNMGMFVLKWSEMLPGVWIYGYLSVLRGNNEILFSKLNGVIIFGTGKSEERDKRPSIKKKSTSVFLFIPIYNLKSIYKFMETTSYTTTNLLTF